MWSKRPHHSPSFPGGACMNLTLFLHKGTSEPTSSTSRPIPEETENSTTDYTDTNTSSTPLGTGLIITCV